MESLIGRSLDISDYFASVILHIFEKLGTFPRKKRRGRYFAILNGWSGIWWKYGRKDRGNSESTKTEREVFWKTIREGLVRIELETFCYLDCHSQLQFISHGNLYKKTNYGDFNGLTKRGYIWTWLAKSKSNPNLTTKITLLRQDT